MDHLHILILKMVSRLEGSWQKRNIYSNLWPNVLRENDKNSVEYDFTANILPLPCDQRYVIEDMEYLYKNLTE